MKNLLSTDEIVKHTVGRGYKATQDEYYKLSGRFGDYYYRVYVRAHNKAMREREAAQVAEALSGSGALLALLKRETESLRVEFIERTREWATAQFARFVELAKTSPEYADYHDGSRMNYEGGKRYRQARERVESARRYVTYGESAFIEREVRAAESHYQASIEKLALRIEKKGLNKSALRVKSARLEMNFETTISDGEQSVRAFTILAYGPIQRPHYRYLVK